MLVLSRKLNETIVIDGNIRITVVDIHGNRIRLGIEAPSEVGVYREEVLAPQARHDEPAWPRAGQGDFDGIGDSDRKAEIPPDMARRHGPRIGPPLQRLVRGGR